MPGASVADPTRPWVERYPEGIAWDSEIDTTPVHEQVLAACLRQPNEDALDFLGRKTKFGDLARSINAFAGALQSKFGVRKGTRVALLLPNTPYYVIAYYAVLAAGGTVVNCNPLYTVGELSHIVGDAGADLMVTLDLKVVFEKAEALVEAGHVKSLVVCRFVECLPASKRMLFKLFRRKEIVRLRESRVAAKITAFDRLVAANEKPVPVTIDRYTDVAVQQYTGGTTGVPKGAMLSHANVAANVAQLRIWSVELFFPPSRVVAVLPFFHIFAMTCCMNLPLTNGTQVVMLPRFELRAFLRLLTRTGANVLPAVPTLVQALIRAGERAKPHLTSLQVVVCGGAPLSEELVADWREVSSSRLAEGYGLTEASPVVCCAALKVPSKPLSVGMPIPGTDIRFINVDTGEPVPLGERGELQVKGPQVMLGYFGSDTTTEPAFQDGWLRTGDVGYLDEDGYVFLVDRIKDLIITSGFNVYPRTIEEALMHHDAVEEVNAIGVPDKAKGEVPVAFVKLKEGSAVTEAELKSWLASRVNRLEMPHRIIFKDSLPKTLIGKLSKKELREEYRQMSEKRREQG